MVDVRAVEETLENLGALGVENVVGDVSIFFANGGFVFLEASFVLP